MSLLRDIKLMSHDKSVDLTGVLSCRATFFECLRHNLLSLRQVSSISRHKPDLLLLRSIAGTGDLLSKHAVGIIINNRTKIYCLIFKVSLVLNRAQPYLDFDTKILKSDEGQEK